MGKNQRRRAQRKAKAEAEAQAKTQAAAQGGAVNRREARAQDSPSSKLTRRQSRGPDPASASSAGPAVSSASSGAARSRRDARKGKEKEDAPSAQRGNRSNDAVRRVSLRDLNGEGSFQILGDTRPPEVNTRKPTEFSIDEDSGTFKFNITARASQGPAESRSLAPGKHEIGTITIGDDGSISVEPDDLNKKYFRKKEQNDRVINQATKGEPGKEFTIIEPSKEFKVFYNISEADAQKLAAFEQEHLDDFNKAFELTLQSLDDALQSLEGQTFNSKEEAIAALKEKVHPALIPDNPDDPESWRQKAKSRMEELIGLSTTERDHGDNPPHVPADHIWRFNKKTLAVEVTLTMSDEHKATDSVISLDKLELGQDDGTAATSLEITPADIGKGLRIKEGTGLDVQTPESGEFFDRITAPFVGKLLGITDDGKLEVSIEKEVLPPDLKSEFPDDTNEVTIKIDRSAVDKKDASDEDVRLTREAQALDSKKKTLEQEISSIRSEINDLEVKGSNPLQLERRRADLKAKEADLNAAIVNLDRVRTHLNTSETPEPTSDTDEVDFGDFDALQAGAAATLAEFD
ncbi:MAG: hypothetical protein J5I94_12330 [Phaeodactylibacter sp.]|nr:hypothetical protein [Phaeodactylibacter sp.]